MPPTKILLIFYFQIINDEGRCDGSIDTLARPRRSALAPRNEEEHHYGRERVKLHPMSRNGKKISGVQQIRMMMSKDEMDMDIDDLDLNQGPRFKEIAEPTDHPVGKVLEQSRPGSIKPRGMGKIMGPFAPNVEFQGGGGGGGATIIFRVCVVQIDKLAFGLNSRVNCFRLPRTRPPFLF